MNETLLAAETALFLTFSYRLFRREPLLGVFYFALFLYTIFAQLGYLYYPELSNLIGAQFGERVWVTYTIFVIFSGTTLFIFLGLFSRLRVPLRRVNIIPSPRADMRTLTFLLLWSLLVFQYLMLLLYPDSLTWATVQRESLFQEDLAAALFVMCLKFSVAANIALYCAWRDPPAGKRDAKIRLLLAISLGSMLLFAFKLGNRTDVVAFFLGVVVFEATRAKLRWHHLFKAALWTGATIAFLEVVQLLRVEDAELLHRAILERVILQDYFSPAHMLFTAIHFNYVRPAEVLLSNAGNSLVLMGVPYLQSGITELIRPGVASRSTGYAFYVFSEGYIIAGFWGFLYNGFVLAFWMSVWRTLAGTQSRHFNLLILALMGALAINLTRGQTSYFIKYLYTFVLPGAIVYLAITRQRVALLRYRALPVPGHTAV